MDVSFICFLKEVLEKSHISGDFFMSYLHQNYIDFFTSLDDVTRAADYLSQADVLSSDWTVCKALIYLMRLVLYL